jgi:futalosine hydrolase
MKILLCAATEMEIAPTIRFLSTHQFHGIEILVTGPSLMTTTYALTKSVHVNRPDLIIQAGIAGSFESTKALGTIVAVKNETVGDLGVNEETGFKSLFDLKLAGDNLYPWKDGRLINETDLLDKAGLRIVNAVSVNEISTNTPAINYYRHQLNAEIESMEGAALHYVGLMERIPFLQIRSLSNFIGERDKTKWKMQEAIANLNNKLQELLPKYIKE